MWVPLWREFCAQFFQSDTIASEIHARQRFVSILAFLVTPGVFLLVLLYPDFASALIRVRHGRAPASMVDDRLEWVVFWLTTYAMAGTGFITVLSWEALTFSRQDAMVLGPLPIPPTTLLSAKIAALGALLCMGAVPMTGLNAAVFALETTDPPGLALFALRFLAVFMATMAAAAFTFAAIVALRGAAVVFGRPRVASALGPPLQFLFIVTLMSLVFLSPAFFQTRAITVSVPDALPSVWFVGVFEHLRAGPRADDAAFVLYWRRALIATPTAVLTALVCAVLTFRSQMRRALASSPASDRLGRARLRRWLARPFVGRHPVARATSDFLLLTLARGRAQQAPIAIHAALGAVLVIAALSQRLRDLSTLSHPRTVLLWAPLVMGYWMVLGMRQAFFVPSEWPATWTFRVTAPAAAAPCRSAIRGSMIALILPPLCAATALVFGPLMGGRIAMWHTLVVAAVTVLLIEIATLTVPFVPFTRAYEPGHTDLKLFWPLYALGVYVFAYGPARLELAFIDRPAILVGEVAACVVAAVVIGCLDCGTRRRWVDVQNDDSDQDTLGGVAVLNISA